MTGDALLAGPHQHTTACYWDLTIGGWRCPPAGRTTTTGSDVPATPKVTGMPTQRGPTPSPCPGATTPGAAT